MTIRIDVGKVFFGIIFLGIAAVTFITFIIIAIVSLLLPIDLRAYSAPLIIALTSGAVGFGLILRGISLMEIMRHREVK